MRWRSLGLAPLASLAAALVVEAAAPPSPPARRETRIPVDEGPGHLAAHDVTGDGIADLLVCNERGASISVVVGSGQGPFSPAPGSPFAAGPNPNDLAIADVDGSGSLDLVVAN